MPAFHETVMGRNFFEGQIPRMAKGIEGANTSIEKLTVLMERQCALLEEQNALLRNLEKGQVQAETPVNSVAEYDKVVITDNHPDDVLPIKYWSNAAGDLFNPIRPGIDSWETVIQPHELPRELQNAYYNLWTDSCGSYCHLVEYAGRYGIALINEYELGEEGMIEGRAQETLKLLKDKEIPYLEACADEEDRELIVVLPWDISREDFEKVTNFLYKTAYDKNVSYEDYKNAVQENVVTSVKYWSNELGELFRPVKDGEDLWNNRIQEEDLPDALKTAYDQLWTDESGSSCYLVEAYGTYGVALVAEYLKNSGFTAERLNERRDEILKMLAGEKIPYVTTYTDARHGELVTILPWYASKEEFDKTADFIQKTAYDKNATYEGYKLARDFPNAKFYEDLTNVSNVADLSGGAIADYYNPSNGVNLALSVVEDFYVTYKGKDYYYPCFEATEIPQEIKTVVQKGFEAIVSSDVEPYDALDKNNLPEHLRKDTQVKRGKWFEIWADKVDGGEKPFPYYWKVDCENYTPAAIYHLLLEKEQEVLKDLELMAAQAEQDEREDI